jgi:hypothetical protein
LTSVTETTGREKELIDTEEFWGCMIKEGSKVCRQDDLARSALVIVDYILSLEEKSIVTDLAKDLIDKHRPFSETSARYEEAVMTRPVSVLTRRCRPQWRRKEV